ncbi:ring-opening amidohydrolase [bacterium]|nr:MAG: ring-opening amidohydrolase [bacterium]
MTSQRVSIHLCEMKTPTDVSEVEALLGKIDPHSIVGVIGKTEGTGLSDDYARVVADWSLRDAIGARTGWSRDEVGVRVAFVLSGGCFGAVTPHVSIITREDMRETPHSGKWLAVGRGWSDEIFAEDVGRSAQIRKVAAAVRQAQVDASIDDVSDIHCVLVKAPSLTRETIEDARRRGKDVVTTDLGVGENGAMCFSNDGSALGVALALGEIAERDVNDTIVRQRWDLYSEVASTSSGGEKRHAEIFLLGNSTKSVSDLRIGHGITRDFIDQEGIKSALRSAGLDFDCAPNPEQQSHVVAVFAKMIVPGDGQIRGHSSTLLRESNPERTAKAVGGALIGSVIGETRFFMSGGERNSHQGPPGGSPVAAVVRP